MTTKMIVETVLMKPTVVCNNHVRVSFPKIRTEHFKKIFFFIDFSYSCLFKYFLKVINFQKLKVSILSQFLIF